MKISTCKEEPFDPHSIVIYIEERYTEVKKYREYGWEFTSPEKTLFGLTDEDLNKILKSIDIPLKRVSSDTIGVYFILKFPSNWGMSMGKHYRNLKGLWDFMILKNNEPLHEFIVDGDMQTNVTDIELQKVLEKVQSWE